MPRLAVDTRVWIGPEGHEVEGTQPYANAEAGCSIVDPLDDGADKARAIGKGPAKGAGPRKRAEEFVP